MTPIAMLLVQAAAAQLCPDGVSRVPAGAPCPRYVFFDSGESEIRREWETVLDAARALTGRVLVEGHSDTPGSAAGNLRLSQERADGVAAALVSRGIARDRIVTRALGESALLVPTADGVREVQNRRVTITSIP